MALFSEIDVWIDQLARSGAENMAVDQLVFEQLGDKPMIRFYEWLEPSVSFGYFEKLSDAKAAFTGNELHYVRRWTGGGIVDHRVDQTYTLFIPKGHTVEQMRGNASYEAIHRVLADSLLEVGISCDLIQQDAETESRACFEKPVVYDLVSAIGKKLAGAGQKRSRNGLLHQGSVVGVENAEAWQRSFVEALSESWAQKNITEEMLCDVQKVVSKRYGSQAWLEKRV